MKRYIRSIYAMSINRKYAIERIESLRKPLEEHLCKCVIYKDDLDCLDHWIKEISDFLDVANDNIIKNGKKLSADKYAELLLGGFGNSESDKIAVLKHFSVLYMKGQYPKVPVTLDMVDSLSYIVRKLDKEVCPLLAKPNDLDNKDFKEIIEKLFSNAGIV